MIHKPGETPGIETFEERKVLYRGRILTLAVDRVRLPSGAPRDREVVTHAPAAAVLPLPDERTVLLIRQYRHPARQVLWEIPAGLVEAGESPEETAARELQEETGFAARRWETGPRFFTSPGFSDEVIHLFVARDLIPSPLPGDEDEWIAPVAVPVQDLEQMIRSGAVVDGKTLLALSWYLGQCRTREA